MFSKAVVRRVGGCRLGPQLGTGSTATVVLGQLRGPGGFGKLVAVKRLRSEWASDPECVRRLAEEGRIGAAIAHPNLAGVVDVLGHRGQLLLVMDYIEGETLARILSEADERKSAVPVAVARRVLSDVLHGVHAAHTTITRAAPLGIVYRDVSAPHIMVGVDGIARVLGVEAATAASEADRATPSGILARRANIAPEQVRREPVDGRANVFAAGVLLWEMLCGQRLFTGETTEQVMAELLAGYVPLVSLRRGDVGRSLDDVVQRALSRQPAKRFASALQFAEALEATGPLASRAEVAAWVRNLAGKALAHRAQRRAEFEASLPRARPTRSSAERPWQQTWRSNAALVAKATAALSLTAMLLSAVGCLSLFDLDRPPAQAAAAFPPRPTAPIAKPCVALPPAPLARPSEPAPSDDVPAPVRPESLRLERRAAQTRATPDAQRATGARRSAPIRT